MIFHAGAEDRIGFPVPLSIRSAGVYDDCMEKKEYRYEENELLCATLMEVGKVQREKLLEIMAESYPAESLTAVNILDQDLCDEEIEKRYANILEGLALGRLIGTVLASTENARDSLLKLTEGSDLHDAFASLFESWKDKIGEEKMMELFKLTLTGMVEDGIAEEEKTDRILLN